MHKLAHIVSCLEYQHRHSACLIPLPGYWAFSPALWVCYSPASPAWQNPNRCIFPSLKHWTHKDSQSLWASGWTLSLASETLSLLLTVKSRLMFANQLHIGTKIRLGENKNVLVPKLLMLKPSLSPLAVSTDVETDVTPSLSPADSS